MIVLAKSPQCFNVCFNDIDYDGICDELEIFGCTDENSPNFDINSTEDDGSCIDCDIYIENITHIIDNWNNKDDLEKDLLK